MNREKYKKTFGEAKVNNLKKNRTCKYKDCNYCLKFNVNVLVVIPMISKTLLIYKYDCRFL